MARIADLFENGAPSLALFQTVIRSSSCNVLKIMNGRSLVSSQYYSTIQGYAHEGIGGPRRPEDKK